MSRYDQYSDEELIFRLRQGEMEISDYLMEKYKEFVRKKARAMFLIGGETDDLIQEGMIGLFKAIQNHLPLNTYISLSNEEESEHLEGSWDSRTEDPESIVIDQESTRNLELKISKALSPMENKVLDYYMKGYGYVKIAEIMGKTPKSIDNALQRIRGKIRNFSLPFLIQK